MKEVLGYKCHKGLARMKAEISMPTKNIKIAEALDGDAEERAARLEWLRAAVKKGLDEIEAGQGIEFSSIEDAEAEIDRIADEVERSLA